MKTLLPRLLKKPMSLLKWLCWTEGKYSIERPAFYKNVNAYHPAIPLWLINSKTQMRETSPMTSDIHWQRTSKWHASPTLRGWQKQVHPQSCAFRWPYRYSPAVPYGSPQPDRGAFSDAPDSQRILNKSKAQENSLGAQQDLCTGPSPRAEERKSKPQS